MKLFLVHCGFYDGTVFDGVYESHVNFFVVARDFEEARLKAKKNPVYQGKRMHIDGLQQLDAIDGFRVQLDEDKALEGQSHVLSHRYRGLAPKKVNDTSSLH